MRIFSVLASAAVIAVAFGVEPTRSLDGTPSSPQAALSPAMSPVDAMRSATEALKTGEKKRAVISLQYAAEHGHGFALWQLGRMYAEGDGVARDDYRAFEYFQKFADSHADENPAIPRARFVANAFVALGHYYLDGIPNTAVPQSPELARRMFAHAASYFGDPEAQFQLAIALPRRQRRHPRSQAGGAVAGAGRQQGPLQVAGGARPHPVQRRAWHAPARVGPDVAHRRLRRAGRQGGLDHRAARNAR